jgi:hypothetical protein
MQKYAIGPAFESWPSPYAVRSSGRDPSFENASGGPSPGAGAAVVPPADPGAVPAGNRNRPERDRYDFESFSFENLPASSQHKGRAIA